MVNKFLRRNYPIALLNETREKLLQLDRLEVVMPKSAFHIKYILLHNPKITWNTSYNDILSNYCEIYFVLPFYNIKRVNGEVNSHILNVLLKCKSKRLRELAMDMSINHALTKHYRSNPQKISVKEAK